MRLHSWVLALCLAASLPAGALLLRTTVIDVDQDASTLNVSPSGKKLLVDTGKNGHGARVKAAMARAGVAQTDQFVTTRYREVHYGGADELVAAPNPVSVVDVHHGYGG